MSGKVIDFNARKKQTASNRDKPDAVALKLLKISDEIDHVILKHVENGDVDVRDLAGLLSHRLGTLMRHIDDKDQLVPLCLRVMKKQAKVD